jgi:integral membrane protein (TIGR00529 family)
MTVSSVGLAALFGLVAGTPALVKVLGSLAIILAVNLWLRRLGWSLVVGIVALAFWSGHTPTAAGQIAWERVSSEGHCSLLMVTFLVIWLSSQMAKAGTMRELADTVRRGLAKRWAVAVLPSLIGMLPMPGGALFSAPMVGDCDPENALDAEHRTAVNYWFRHVWEYWWPLYPGILLAVTITKLDIWQLMLAQFPMSVAAWVGGYWFLLRSVHVGNGERERFQTGRFFVLMAPVVIGVGVYAVLRIAMPAMAAANRYLPLVIGIVIGMGFLAVQRPLPWREWQTIVLQPRAIHLGLLVTLVRVYGAFIEAPVAGGATLVETMQQELSAWHVPAIAICMILPFASGMVAGLAVGFVGASYPVVMAMLGADPSVWDVAAVSALAYGFGHSGQMLSPVHICLIVTKEHFDSKLTHSMRRIVGPACVVMAMSLVIYAILHAIGS